MGTLYDLLGALPDDDAEDLRTAFRKAAKATHPDINPDDPDASLRFRQLVRAHDILSDAEQRATYDQLLAFAQSQPGSDSKRTVIYQSIHKHASNTVAATIISAMLIGGYMLFEQVSKASVIPEKLFETAPRGPTRIAAITVAAELDASGLDEPRDRRERIGTPGEAITTGAATAAAGPPAVTDVDPAPNPAMNDAQSYRARGISAYRGGDLYRALADFDLAIQRDPGFAEAYIDRGIVLYRMREFERAFADIAQAKRIENSSRTRTSAPAPRKATPVKTHDTLSQ